MKKIIAFAGTLMMLVSMLAISASAATDGCTATLEFAGYETKGTSTFAVINVKATIPDTLVPYEMIPADWETTFEDSYKGKMLAQIGFDIPNVDGLAYVDSLSSVSSYVFKQNNTAKGQISIYCNNADYATAYAGEVGTLATLWYRITGDKDATYNLALSNATIELYDFANPASSTPSKIKYMMDDFTVTNAVIKPEEPVGPTIDSIDATQEPYAAVKPGDVLNEESAQAVAYWAQSTFETGQTAYWTATINSAPKKKEISLANVSGTAKLGIVITGATSVENVMLNVVTPAGN